MLGSGGRESFQVIYRGQDSGIRMKVPALITHPFTAKATTTTTTVTLHKQTYGGGNNSQRGPFTPHEAVVVSASCGSPQFPHYGTARRLLPSSPSTPPEARVASGFESGVVGVNQGGVTGVGQGNMVDVGQGDLAGVGQGGGAGCFSNTGGGDDLTSLSWLHSLDMGGMVPHLATPPTPPASPQPHNPLYSMFAAHASPTDRKRKAEVQEPVERIDYSKDGSVKPPYSYAALIGMAMKENQNKMTLSSIYKWIKENFAYYKTADPSWQNSIRHNLSLNKCFLKVARSKDEPGKGGFWRLDPEYADSLVDGVFKKRRPSRTTLPPPSKSKKSRKQTSQQQMQQHIQQLGIKVVVQPTQAAFMPPPTNKPPPRSTLYLSHDGTEVDGEVGESGSSLKDDLVWSTLLGEEVNDDSWSCRTQELVTDLSQTGDPSTYPTTVTTTTDTTLIPAPHLHHNLHNHHFHISDHHHPQVITITATSNSTPPSLPSLELSPASLGVEEELFTSPELSEASNDDADSLTSSLEISNGGWSKAGYVEQLPSMNTLCSSLTPLTPMEPTPIISSAAPVLVQDAHACWGPDTNWDEAKTLSLLDANLDLANLIDLDVL